MVVSRLFNVVGPRQRGTYGMVLPRFVGQAVRGADLTVYGDGSQSRCFLHIADAVPALIGLLECDIAIGEIYNVGSPRVVRIDDLAKLVIERTGSSSGIRYVPFDVAYEAGFEDLEHRVPDISAVQRVIGWEPQRSLEEAVDDTFNELRRNVEETSSQDPDYVA
jgi:UDP-glucose 4-epimerase